MYQCTFCLGDSMNVQLHSFWHLTLLERCNYLARLIASAHQRYDEMYLCCNYLRFCVNTKNLLATVQRFQATGLGTGAKVRG